MVFYETLGGSLFAAGISPAAMGVAAAYSTFRNSFPFAPQTGQASGASLSAV